MSNLKKFIPVKPGEELVFYGERHAAVRKDNQMLDLLFLNKEGNPVKHVEISPENEYYKTIMNPPPRSFGAEVIIHRMADKATPTTEYLIPEQPLGELDRDLVAKLEQREFFFPGILEELSPSRKKDLLEMLWHGEAYAEAAGISLNEVHGYYSWKRTENPHFFGMLAEHDLNVAANAVSFSLSKAFRKKPEEPVFYAVKCLTEVFRGPLDSQSFSTVREKAETLEFAFRELKNSFAYQQNKDDEDFQFAEKKTTFALENFAKAQQIDAEENPRLSQEEPEDPGCDLDF